MNAAAVLFNQTWRDRVLAAVSPLKDGTQPLKVNGYRPVNLESHRPNRTAAVLVPLLDMDQPEVVLTRRADHLSQHPGQVSFPGGAAEANDDSAVHTALREAEEEIGLPPDQARPIGFLDRMDVISDFRVLPVVALVQPPVSWVIDTTEVAEVFTVPLSIALDRDRYQSRHITRDGVDFHIWSMQWKQFNIWGATAAMLLNLADRIDDVSNQ
jgi:8-oxo-dGTP pyrophosphatase MutT (NUDIX family)